MKYQVAARLPHLLLAGVLSSATGCVDLGLFSSIQAGYADDCTRVAVIWTEQSAGGTLVPTEISCATISTQSAQNPELVKACEFELAPPARCTGSDVADATVDSEVGQPDSEVGQETAEVSPDGETDGSGPEAEVGPETDVPVVCAEDCDLQDTVCQDFSCVGGTCVPENLTAECDDGEACTHTDLCVAGVCQGTAYDCTPEAECQESTCNGEGGCSEPVAKAGWCALSTIIGGVACLEQGQQFVFGALAACLSCAGDGTSTGGFVATPDGTACSEACIEDATCQSGVCIGTPVVDGTSCVELNPCKTPGTCQAGECEDAELKLCSDGNACTADVCLSNGLCSNPTATPSGVKVGGFSAADVYIFGTSGSGSLGPTSVVRSGGGSAAVVPIKGPTTLGRIDSPTTLEAVGTQDLALVMMDAFGNPPIVRQLDGGGGGTIEVERSAGSNVGIAISGASPATTNFGTVDNPMTIEGADNFVAGFDTDLSTVFAVRHDNPQPSVLVAQSDGSYSVAISAPGDVTWPSAGGGLILKAAGGTTSYWLRLDGAGLASTGFQIASGLDPTLSIDAGTTVASNAVTFVGGTYGNPITVGPADDGVAAPPLIGRDGFISKHWASGELAWVQWITSTGDITIEDILPNGSGLTVLGTYQNPTGGIIDLSGNSIGSSASQWTFIISVDGNGDLVWSAVLDGFLGANLDDGHFVSGTKGFFVDLKMKLGGDEYAITAGEGDTFVVRLDPITGVPSRAYGLFTPTGQIELASTDSAGLWTAGPGFPLSASKIGLTSAPKNLPSTIGGSFWWAMRLTYAPCF